MANTIQALVDIGERAYSNLYDVTILKGTEDISNFANISLQALVEKVSFGGEQTLSTFYSEAMMQSFVDKVNRIKTLSLGIRETYDYKIFSAIQAWQNSIYDFKNNCFLPGDPRGTIRIELVNSSGDYTLNDPASRRFMYFKVSGAVPTGLSYPSYSYSSSEALVTNVTFTFDDVSLETNT